MLTRLGFLATLALALVQTVPSTAADLVRPGTIPASVAQTFSWTGFYAGAQAGYRRTDVGFSDPAFVPRLAGTYSVHGVSPGVHVGAAYQMDMLVLGVIADVNLGDGRGSGIARVPGTTVRGSATANWDASLSARAGLAFDRVQVFASAGWAWADYDFSYSFQGVTDRFSETLDGWTVGAGLEYAFTSNFIGRVEYRYTDLGDASGSIAKCCAGPPNRQVHSPTIDKVTLGLSYKY